MGCMESKPILRQKVEELFAVGVISLRTRDRLITAISEAMTDDDWANACGLTLNAISEGADHGFSFGLNSANQHHHE